MRAGQIIHPLQEFGPCLKRILEKRKVSASELARMMAYKSRNSIFRILDEAGGHSARKAFYDRLIDEDPLALHAQERAALEQALEVSRVGEHAFLSNCALREMLMDADMGKADAGMRPVVLCESGEKEFQQALAEMVQGKRPKYPSADAVTGRSSRRSEHGVINRMRQALRR